MPPTVLGQQAVKPTHSRKHWSIHVQWWIDFDTQWLTTAVSWHHTPDTPSAQVRVPVLFNHLQYFFWCDIPESFRRTLKSFILRRRKKVFKFIHIFRLGCISMAGRKEEGVILQVIMDGITDQSFAIKEESVWVSTCMASGSTILLATCALKILISQGTPNLNAPNPKPDPPWGWQFQCYNVRWWLTPKEEPRKVDPVWSPLK